jgi:hypothetical protein
VKTLESITEVCKTLDRCGVTADEAPRVLALTQQFLALSQQVRESDPDATPAKVISTAKERIQHINQKP